jgi:predicted RNA-binding Zn-ribbon protein involved in translation (DUF1610 family)
MSSFPISTWSSQICSTSHERADVLTEQHVRGAPDLVIELFSPSTRKTRVLGRRSRTGNRQRLSSHQRCVRACLRIERGTRRQAHHAAAAKVSVTFARQHRVKKSRSMLDLCPASSDIGITLRATAHHDMPPCPTCGRSLIRRHRTWFERMFYAEAFRCRHCERPVRRFHRSLSVNATFLLSRHTHCPKCGTANVHRTAKRDKVDSFSRHPASRVFHVIGAPISKCPACRLQYFDWRPVHGNLSSD